MTAELIQQLCGADAIPGLCAFGGQLRQCDGGSFLVTLTCETELGSYVQALGWRPLTCQQCLQDCHAMVAVGPADTEQQAGRGCAYARGGLLVVGILAENAGDESFV
ncbi:hypothetical protein ACU686_42520 [Yinghuangia aomiensis]